MSLTPKQENFYKKWHIKRANKIKYLLINGLLYWALPFSLFLMMFELYDQQFIFSTSILIKFLSVFVITGVLGILKALLSFNTIDKSYLALKNKEEI